ncbi:MAG: malate dehydrogenase [Candidatus Omnitrophota bacterium]
MKVSIIGAGNVGAQAAQAILRRNIADVTLVDIIEGLAQGKALDLGHAAVIEGCKNKIIGTTDFTQTQKSDIVVVTAGLTRKPGETRSELLTKNAKITKEVMEKIKTHAKNAIILMVTNPLDAMTYLAYKSSGLDRKRIFGMAGVLDTSRFKYVLSERFNVPHKDIEATILGEHGDSMVIVPRLTVVKGMPLARMIPTDEIGELTACAKNSGAEIVALLKTSASYAPGAAIACMVEAILTDSKKILPASAYLEGEYGLKDLCIGVPVRLGNSGIEEVIELKLEQEEKQALIRSAEKIKEDLGHLF